MRLEFFSQEPSANYYKVQGARVKSDEEIFPTLKFSPPEGNKLDAQMLSCVLYILPILRQYIIFEIQRSTPFPTFQPLTFSTNSRQLIPQLLPQNVALKFQSTCNYQEDETHAQLMLICLGNIIINVTICGELPDRMSE